MTRQVVITGGGSGIGLATSRMFLEHGATVWAVGRTLERLETARDELGSHYHPVVLDVSDRAEVDKFFASLKSLDVLVVNHGICKEATLDAPESDDIWDETIRINLNGAYNVIRAASPKLHEGGRIIAVSSGLGKYGRSGHEAYVASKHGLLGLTRSAAKELAPRKITVNAICPGWVETEMSLDNIVDTAKRKGTSPESLREAALAGIPIGRFVQPQECADLIYWLASPLAAAITGQAYNISGGEF